MVQSGDARDGVQMMALGSRLLHRARRLRGDESGLALIEFAYSLPVLMILSMGGLEIANLSMAHMRISQIAMLVADNAARERASIDEADINEIFTGAEQAGSNIKNFKANTRIYLSDLEPNGQTGTEAGQYIRWQRCWLYLQLWQGRGWRH